MKIILKNRWAIKPSIVVIIMLLNSILNVSAQITIGSGEESAAGTLLQLKDIENASAGAINSYKGLGLPRVNLTDLNNLYPMFLSDPDDPTSGSTLEYTTGKASIDELHTGLVVYNVGNKDIYSGVYYWDGTTWRATSKEAGGSIIDQYANFKIIKGLYTIANPYVVQDDDYVLILRFQGTGTNGWGNNTTDGNFTIPAAGQYINAGANLILPDPTTCPGRILRIINDLYLIDRNKNVVHVYTNYPMFCYDSRMGTYYTSSVTSSWDMNYMIWARENWYKWNIFSDGKHWISISPVEI